MIVDVITPTTKLILYLVVDNNIQQTICNTYNQNNTLSCDQNHNLYHWQSQHQFFLSQREQQQQTTTTTAAAAATPTTTVTTTSMRAASSIFSSDKDNKTITTTTSM